MMDKIITEKEMALTPENASRSDKAAMKMVYDMERTYAVATREMTLEEFEKFYPFEKLYSLLEDEK